MKRPCIVFLVTAVVLMTAGVSVPLAGSDGDDTLRACYRQCIDTCIRQLDRKVRYIDSDSATLQGEALRAAMKKVFFEQYREPLVDRMIRDRVVRKPYKVEYYLDRQFFGVIHPRLALR